MGVPDLQRYPVQCEISPVKQNEKRPAAGAILRPVFLWEKRYFYCEMDEKDAAYGNALGIAGMPMPKEPAKDQRENGKCAANDQPIREVL